MMRYHYSDTVDIGPFKGQQASLFLSGGKPLLSRMHSISVFSTSSVIVSINCKSLSISSFMHASLSLCFQISKNKFDVIRLCTFPQLGPINYYRSVPVSEWLYMRSLLGILFEQLVPFFQFIIQFVGYFFLDTLSFLLTFESNRLPQCIARFA